MFREIKRHKFVDEVLPKLSGYCGMTAQKSAADRRGRRCKLVRFVGLRQHVIAQLKIGPLSSLQAAKRGQRDHQIKSRVGYDLMTSLFASAMHCLTGYCAAMSREGRKHYSSEEKIRIVLDGLRGEDSIAELCRPLPPVGSILRMRLSGNGQGHAKHDPERGEVRCP